MCLKMLNIMLQLDCMLSFTRNVELINGGRKPGGIGFKVDDKTFGDIVELW